jgi:hypothetical protein
MSYVIVVNIFGRLDAVTIKAVKSIDYKAVLLLDIIKILGQYAIIRKLNRVFTLKVLVSSNFLISFRL